MCQHLVRDDLGARRGVEANADAINSECTAHYCRSLALALVYLRREELEVLRHVAKGMTSKEIGHVLFISENTVKNHVRNILDKLGLHSRNEAVLYAVREHLIEL